VIARSACRGRGGSEVMEKSERARKLSHMLHARAYSAECWHTTPPLVSAAIGHWCTNTYSTSVSVYIRWMKCTSQIPQLAGIDVKAKI
jgi:hypothetical protein